MRAPAALVALMLALALAAAPAAASDWTMQPGSWLGFETSYDGEPFEGRFARFTPTLRFDPADLAHARFDVAIDLASADTGHDERDEVLVGEDFFAAGASGRARYVATTFRALGDGRFVADGTLTLRGVAKPVALAFTWKAGAQPVLDGEATVSRLAFGVGTGDDWADTELLPDAVKVRTHLVLAAQPRKASSAAASNGQSSSAPESSRRRTGMRVP